MWWKPAYIGLLEEERRRLLIELENLKQEHKREVQGFRSYIDQLTRRLFEKYQVPSPEPRPDEVPKEPFDPFSDLEETEVDTKDNRELDEFVR